MKKRTVGLVMAVTLLLALSVAPAGAQAPQNGLVTEATAGRHYATRDTQGPPSVALLERLHDQGLKLVTIVPLGDRYRTYLQKTQPARVIKLTPVDDVVGAGREWFHAEYVPAAPDCPAPTFTVTPDIWIEPYWRDPFYGWIAGEAGTYTVTAKIRSEECDAEGSLVIVIAH